MYDMYAFNDFQIRTFLSTFALAIESIIWESAGENPHTRSPLISLHLSAEKLLVTILLPMGFYKKNSSLMYYSFVTN